MGIFVPVRLRTIEAVMRAEHGSLRQMTVDERSVLSKWVRIMELAIEQAWPVDTGFSRDGYQTVISGNPTHPTIGGYGFAISNPVFYVQWVRRAGEKQVGLGPLWRRLIPEVVRRYQASLNAELTAEIRRTEARLQQGASLLDILQRSFRPPSAAPQRVSIRFGSQP